MVKIRLARRGRKKYPIYNIVAADSRSPRDGKFLEKLGLYNPKGQGEETISQLKKVAIQKWIETGAQMTPSVKSLFKKHRVDLASSAS